MATAARGTTLWWDAGNTGNGNVADGGTGIWDTTSPNWLNTNTAQNVVWANGPNDTAIFGLPSGGAGIVSVVGTVSVSRITVRDMVSSNRTYSFTNSAITISGPRSGGTVLVR
jgi:hypothetical protein